MPLFEIGYRRYEGRHTSHAARWWPITRAGLAIAWQSKLLRRLVFASFLPILYFGWVFFVLGRITDPGADPQGPFYRLAREALGPRLVAQMQEDPSAIRGAVWAAVFASLGGFFQLLMAGVVAAIVGPPLVANDLRSRAFLIYFSRPVTRVDYLLGKLGTLLVLLAAVTTLPSLLLYVLSILFSPSFGTIAQTAPVLGTMFVASIGTILPAALVVLMLSSLVQQPRFAAVAWVVVCAFGPIAHQTLRNTRGLADNGWIFLLSLPETVRALQLGLYDVPGRLARLEGGVPGSELFDGLTGAGSPGRAAAGLAVFAALSVVVLLRRVDAPTRD